MTQGIDRHIVGFGAGATMNTSDEIIPGLHMGNITSAQLVEDFDLVVNMAQDAPRPWAKEYIHWEIDDGQMPEDIERLDGIVNFICGVLNDGGQVLVHCNAGVNRSGLVTARVVMEMNNLSGTDAIDLVRSKRPRGPFPNIICNPWFETYLNKLEAPEPALNQVWSLGYQGGMN